MSRHIVLSLLISLAILPTLVMAHDTERAANPSAMVRVHGSVTAPRNFDLAALQHLATQDSGPVDVICASGATMSTAGNYRGVLLTNVINAVGLDFQGHKDGRRMVIIVRATDGYAVTFSWNELFNTAIGPEVLVAWEKDGKPLEARDGQLLLISGKDIKTGPRHVRNLSDIEVLRMN